MTERLPNYDNFDDLLPDLPSDPSDYIHKDGSLTAEAIGYTSLSRELLSQESLIPLHSFKKAWSVIELGLTAPSYQTRQGFMDIAQERLDMILADPTVHDDLRMRTILARVALPSFRARAEQEPLTESLQLVTYHNLIRYIGEEVSRDIYHGKGVSAGPKGCAIGSLCEGLAYAALLKSGDPALFAFPAGPREDKSPQLDQNHDLYIPYRHTKIPAQVKRKNIARLYPDTIKINVLPHINNQLQTEECRTEQLHNPKWAKAVASSEPDVLLAQYLDPNSPQYVPENASIANFIIDGVSKSIGESVREQMADIIRRKGLGISTGGGLV